MDWMMRGVGRERRTKLEGKEEERSRSVKINKPVQLYERQREDANSGKGSLSKSTVEEAEESD
jgi:hypothetical protein